MLYTVIQANKEQVDKLYNKHLKPERFLGFILPRVISYKYGYDDEDEIGFVTIKTFTGKIIQYQFRRGTPCFVSFIGFGDIRYDISYPREKSIEMYDELKKWGDLAEKEFWAESEI